MSAPRLARPRPRARVLIDPSNAYARLGVSPLETTEGIKALILKKRNEVVARRNFRADQQFGKEEQEIGELDRIEKEIGTPRARAAYDLEHPQNELLTVQPSRSSLLRGGNRASLVSAWLASELGREAFVPSPDCLSLWAPGGVDAALLRAVEAFAEEGARERAPSSGEVAVEAPPEVNQLGRSRSV